MKITHFEFIDCMLYMEKHIEFIGPVLYMETNHNEFIAVEYYAWKHQMTLSLFGHDRKEIGQEQNFFKKRGVNFFAISFSFKNVRKSP